MFDPFDPFERHEWVLDALATIRGRLPGSPLLIPPTVSEELAWLTAHGEELSEREAAGGFLRRLVDGKPKQYCWVIKSRRATQILA